MKKASFLIAIDSYIIRKGVVTILRNISGAELLLDTSSPDMFKNQVKEQEPDYIVISSDLYEKTIQFFSDHPHLTEKTILLDSHENELNSAFAVGRMNLTSSKKEIVEQFENLVEPYLHKKEDFVSILSDREVTILKYIATGYTNRQIAEKLFLSLHTVTTHRKNIGNKLGIKSVSGLTVYAIVNNIISIEDIANTTGR